MRDFDDDYQYGALPPRRSPYAPPLRAPTGPLGGSLQARAAAQARVAQSSAGRLAQIRAAQAAQAAQASTSAGCSRALLAAGVSCEQQAGLQRMGLSAASSLQQQQAQARAAGGYLSRQAPAPSYTSGSTTSSSSSSTGCSTALVAAGVSCEQQAGLRRMGAPVASSLIQQQAQARAAGGYISHQQAPTTWQPGSYTAESTSGYAPAGSTYPARPIDTLRARFAAMLRGHSLVSGQSTQAGYQMTGPYVPPNPAAGTEMVPAGVPAVPAAPVADSGMSQLAPAQVPPTEAGQLDAIRALYQQSRTARGLMTLEHPVMGQPGASLEQVAPVIFGLADPDRRMTTPEPIGYLYQVSSEQAVRVGNLAMAQLLASLASRYPVPRALAGFDLGGVGGMGWGGWMRTAILVGAAAMGILWIRDARRAELTPAGRTRHDGYPKSRRNSRRRR